jgi:hypothetical protein
MIRVLTNDNPLCHYLPLVDDRPHHLAADCWCTPVICWRSQVEDHSGHPEQVVVHREWVPYEPMPIERPQ